LRSIVLICLRPTLTVGQNARNRQPSGVWSAALG